MAYLISSGFLLLAAAISWRDGQSRLALFVTACSVPGLACAWKEWRIHRRDNCSTTHRS